MQKERQSKNIASKLSAVSTNGEDPKINIPNQKLKTLIIKSKGIYACHYLDAHY